MLLFVLTFCQVTPLAAKRHAHRTPPADIGSRPRACPSRNAPASFMGRFDKTQATFSTRWMLIASPIV